MPMLVPIPSIPPASFASWWSRCEHQRERSSSPTEWWQQEGYLRNGQGYHEWHCSLTTAPSGLARIAHGQSGGFLEWRESHDWGGSTRAGRLTSGRAVETRRSNRKRFSTHDQSLPVLRVIDRSKPPTQTIWTFGFHWGRPQSKCQSRGHSTRPKAASSQDIPVGGGISPWLKVKALKSFSQGVWLSLCAGTLLLRGSLSGEQEMRKQNRDYGAQKSTKGDVKFVEGSQSKASWNQ